MKTIITLLLVLSSFTTYSAVNNCKTFTEHYRKELPWNQKDHVYYETLNLKSDPLKWEIPKVIYKFHKNELPQNYIVVKEYSQWSVKKLKSIKSTDLVISVFEDGNLVSKNEVTVKTVSKQNMSLLQRYEFLLTDIQNKKFRDQGVEMEEQVPFEEEYRKIEDQVKDQHLLDVRAKTIEVISDLVINTQCEKF